MKSLSQIILVYVYLILWMYVCLMHFHVLFLSKRHLTRGAFIGLQLEMNVSHVTMPTTVGSDNFRAIRTGEDPHSLNCNWVRLHFLGHRSWVVVDKDWVVTWMRIGRFKAWTVHDLIFDESIVIYEASVLQGYYRIRLINFPSWFPHLR